MGVLYAEEGGITPGEILSEDLSPVQTEIDEMVLLPSGILTHTKAEENSHSYSTYSTSFEKGL